MHSLDQKIWQVLHRLGEQADKERSGKSTIPESEMMLAITGDTGIYFNIMLKAISVNGMIEVHQGTAIDVLKGMRADYNDAPFDFVFIDANKENAINYFDLVFPMVRTGGIIAADNVLYPEGCVVEMGKYARYVKGRSDVELVTVPIGNGEEITIKL